MAEVVRPVVVAAATPSGGALGIVRLTGGASWEVADRVFTPSGRSRPRTVVYGRALDASGGVVDRCCAVYYEGGSSYTGERMVEFFCHGGRAVLEGLVGALVAAGAEPAGPGEFTRRAFLNGKLTLTEAEAVAELSAAENPAVLRAALDQLDGGLDSVLGKLEEGVGRLRSLLEAELEFPEEGEVLGASGEALAEAERVLAEAVRLRERLAKGRTLRSGLRVVLAGMANVGKSSLFNRLCGRERVLVSAEPATTRDVVEERVVLGGRVVVVCDTAGFGPGGTEADRRAQERSWEAVRSAALVLLVRDRSVPLTEGARRMEEEVRGVARRTLLVLNKSDLPAAGVVGDGVEVSARTGEGLERLVEEVGRVLAEETAGEVLLGSERVERLVWELGGRLEAVVRGLKAGGYRDIVSEEAAAAEEVLERLRGRGCEVDVLDAVFAKFCIGK